MRSCTRLMSSDLVMTSLAYRFRHFRKSWYVSRLRSFALIWHAVCNKPFNGREVRTAHCAVSTDLLPPHHCCAKQAPAPHLLEEVQLAGKVCARKCTLLPCIRQ